jgi:sialate O-acetylesterase
MIHPFTVGPMALTSFIWFQGESNCCDGRAYSCLQSGMIASWRTYFKNPTAFFGFVEMEPWIWRQSGTPLAGFRVGQRQSLALPNVGYATGTDIGDPTGW